MSKSGGCSRNNNPNSTGYSNNFYSETNFQTCLCLCCCNDLCLNYCASWKNEKNCFILEKVFLHTTSQEEKAIKRVRHIGRDDFKVASLYVQTIIHLVWCEILKKNAWKSVKRFWIIPNKSRIKYSFLIETREKGWEEMKKKKKVTCVAAICTPCGSRPKIR